MEAAGIEPAEDFGRRLAFQVPITELPVATAHWAMWHLIDFFPFIEANRVERGQMQYKAFVRHFI